jgi:hypothetical protein
MRNISNSLHASTVVTKNNLCLNALMDALPTPKPAEEISALVVEDNRVNVST